MKEIIRIFRVIFHYINVFREVYLKHKIFKESAAMTFVTLMGFIPFSMFILMFLPELSFIENSQIKDVIIRTFLPSSAEKVITYINHLTEWKTSFGLMNFILLFITSFGLFRLINDTFDRILNVHELRKKDLIFNLMRFFGMILFGGFIILIIFSSASLPVFTKLLDIYFLRLLNTYIIPFLLLFMLILLIYLFIPTIRVKRRSIAISAIISSSVWMFAKMFFNWYIRNLTDMELFYGVMSSIPIFLMWVYFNWTIVLSGIIILAIIENRHLKEKEVKKEIRTLKLTLERQVDGEVCNVQSTILDNEELEKVLRRLLGKKS